MRYSVGGRRVVAWIAAAALALLSASRWLDAPRVEYLAVCAIATAAALTLAATMPGTPRWWAAACAGALAVAALMAADAQRRLHVSADGWSASSTRSARAAGTMLAREIGATTAAPPAAAAPGGG